MRIIKFGKSGCPPCQQVDIYLNRENIKYESIDTDTTDNFDLLIEHNIKTVPITLLLNKKGEVITKVVGFSEPSLQHLINDFTNG